jgi:hypothetical protein
VQVASASRVNPDFANAGGPWSPLRRPESAGRGGDHLWRARESATYSHAPSALALAGSTTGSSRGTRAPQKMSRSVSAPVSPSAVPQATRPNAKGPITAMRVNSQFPACRDRREPPQSSDSRVYAGPPRPRQISREPPSDALPGPSPRLDGENERGDVWSRFTRHRSPRDRRSSSRWSTR